MTIDFFDLTYLRQGNVRQQQAYEVMEELQIVGKLDSYHPVLAGTIPLDLDLPESDLDIICEVCDAKRFEQELELHFGACPNYICSSKTVGGLLRTVANFTYRGLAFEVFGQPKPVTEQNAYRHMVIEHRMLEMGGAGTRDAIRKLKAGGLKTEPAFGELFRIDGDPYEALLGMYDWEDARLRQFIEERIGTK
ncbi:DUF4269 domain-containing protein [Paenibacillus sp. MBLB2552]|uniref:DUF4269 domain-containing protein n=1 Tax=Paenibacillus mellifer TaxID=2937794 RepID=A0A9X2BPT4_9BACL|nr:DUF4269 domain-containing protein [Paenibacillus mellifer]MCK8487563.1 DUF4269 domain-containing protein [Paenibacillus mellifer]